MQRVQTELLLASLCTAGKIAWTSERVSARSYLLCTFAANRLSLLSYVAGYKTQSRLPVAIVGQHAIVRRMSALQMRVLEPAMAAVADQIFPVIGASQRFMPGEALTFSPLPNSVSTSCQALLCMHLHSRTPHTAHPHHPGEHAVTV